MWFNIYNVLVQDDEIKMPNQSNIPSSYNLTHCVLPACSFQNERTRVYISTTNCGETYYITYCDSFPV